MRVSVTTTGGPSAGDDFSRALGWVAIQLGRTEPRLAEVLRAAGRMGKKAARAPACCGNARADVFGDELRRIAGPGRKPYHPALPKPEALRAAGEALVALMPDCRGCDCEEGSPMAAEERRGAVNEVPAVGAAGGRTLEEAAAVAGESESTARRRARCPEFRARVAELRSGMVADAAGRLAPGMTRAADTLLQLLGSSDEHVRHETAAKMIALGVEVIELAELRERVAGPERRLADGKA